MLSLILSIILTCNALQQPYAYYYDIQDFNYDKLIDKFYCTNIDNFTVCYLDKDVYFVVNGNKARLQAPSKYEPLDNYDISIDLKNFSCYYPIICEKSENGKIYIKYSSKTVDMEIFVDNSTGDMKILEKKFSGDIGEIAKKLSINGANVKLINGEEKPIDLTAVIVNPEKYMNMLEKKKILQTYKLGKEFSICKDIVITKEEKKIESKDNDLLVIGITTAIILVIIGFAYVKLAQF